MPDPKQQLDRWIALALAAALVGWWGMGWACKHFKSEPYPTLSMPGFPGNGGLTGYAFHERQLLVQIEHADGRIQEATLTDMLLRCGTTRGELPTVADLLVSTRGEGAQMRVDRADPRLWELAGHGVPPDGPVEAAHLSAVRVVLVFNRYDLRAATLDPVPERLHTYDIPRVATPEE